MLLRFQSNSAGLSQTSVCELGLTKTRDVGPLPILFFLVWPFHGFEFVTPAISFGYKELVSKARDNQKTSSKNLE